MASQKVVLISSGQPSLNPRLIKEADSLCDAGYDVTVLYAYWNDWGTVFDRQLIPLKKWKAVRIAGDPQQQKSTYLFSKITHRAAKYINRVTGGKLFTNIAIARSAGLLKEAAKKHRADLYIAHNLGALPSAASAAKLYNKVCGFDAEDFHRYETSDDSNNAEVMLKTKIEDQYLPQVNYFTTSSPQIAEAYQQLYPQLKPVVLLNVFPKIETATKKVEKKGPVKLFWFSQTIGPNRGIDDAVKALQLLNKTDFELHLLGKLPPGSEKFISSLIDSDINLQIHNPVPPDELAGFASQFDIGLALEPGFSINNNIALSNKLFTYMQAGLAIVASDTTAQHDFMTKNATIGHVYPKGDVGVMAAILRNYHQHSAQLANAQNEALRLAKQQYNWETEGLKFLAIVKQTLLQQK
ncbi:glycosyltransferase [Mucilaginibacter sp. UR6-11]|uniref:glycosyltransferase n=1 Tax=Mucilaginibacter sp. UR6-11 TaxID=1435644 RepID=UPI001E5892AE|nr:glycosyltransferase [Mucilaginibacter sp. UR6-11]MCC8425737.1 glycosyltransferase [Mucilaginibacter sp. UR6-11]